jgi:1-pyrroline-5-carboxylate dehydrogenase
MANGVVSVPDPVNEPIRNYAPGSPERASLELRLAEATQDSACVHMTMDMYSQRTTRLVRKRSEKRSRPLSWPGPSGPRWSGRLEQLYY